MDKKLLTISDLRKGLEQVIENDHVLSRLEQSSDDELLRAGLYTDLGMDSIDVWELVCVLERDHEIYVEDSVEAVLDMSVDLTVEIYLNALNNYQQALPSR